MSATPINQWIEITFVADSSTPQDAMQYVGKTYLVPPEDMVDVGSGESNPGKIRGIRGYLQPKVDGSYNFVLISPVPPAIVAAFNALPGADGWVDLTARQTYRDIGLQLLEQYGVAGLDVLDMLTRLYQAAKLNVTTAPPGG